MTKSITLKNILSSDFTFPVLIALLQLTIQILAHGSYGYFRDELYYIACSDHLDFGYVDEPPLSIAILSISRWAFGDSLQAIRLLPSIAGVGVVLLAAAMARRMGGGRFAMGIASLSVAGAGALISKGGDFSMNAFDVFFWALALYIAVRILTGDTPKLWLVFGLVVGLGLLNKYSIGFLCIGLTAGLILTSHRKQLTLKWFWLGALMAFILFLPHIIWEIRYGFPTLEFMHNATQMKNTPTTFYEFFTGQLRDLNYMNAPLWLLGLYFFFFHKDGKQYRTCGWMYVVIFAIMVVGNAKVYYLSPIYPLLLAGGSVFIERFLHKHSWNWIRPVYVSLIIIWTMIVLPFALPVLPIENFIAYQKLLGVTPQAEERSALGRLPQHYADMFGWEEMVSGIAKAYHTLTPDEQTKCVIYVRNYGEAGAIDLFGKKYGLPNAICAHNNYWLWGPGEKTGDVAIILGESGNLQDNLNDLNRHYRSAELAFTTDCNLCMPYENGRQFFICRGFNKTFQILWPYEKWYI